MVGAVLEGYTPDLRLLEDLVMVPGVSGYEDRVRERIMELVSPYGKVEVDRVGNLALHLGGSGPRIVIAAHMDELGLVVTGITEKGLLAFRKIGGINDSILPSRHVTVHTVKGDLPGVIGVDPPHILRLVGKGDQQVRPWHELRIDIGAESREEAEGLGVRVLDMVTFRKHFSVLAKGKYVATRALDDRAGCAALVELARLIGEGRVRLGAELTLAWTVQEEVGLRGARALAERLEPDLFVAVDTTTCCHQSITGNLSLGRGPVVRAIDNHYIASPRLVRSMLDTATSRRVPVQVSAAGGGTDAAVFQLLGVPSIAVSAPVMYTHSLVEKMHLGDYRGWIRLLAVIVETGLAP